MMQPGNPMRMPDPYRPVGVKWDECTPAARRALDKMLGVGPDEKYRYGIFSDSSILQPYPTTFATASLAESLAGQGEHVRRGLVTGATGSGRERVKWETEAWDADEATE